MVRGLISYEYSEPEVKGAVSGRPGFSLSPRAIQLLGSNGSSAMMIFLCYKNEVHCVIWSAMRPDF